MIIHKGSIVLDVDIDTTKAYSQAITLCDCDECRNFYTQARKQLPQLTDFLSDLGISIERPDEITSLATDGEIDYLFVAYTVDGEILETDKYEIDLWDNGLFLNITIDNSYIPNEQQTDRHFTITVYNITLPWVLDKPFPTSPTSANPLSIFSKVKNWLKKK